MIPYSANTGSEWWFSLYPAINPASFFWQLRIASPRPLFPFSLKSSHTIRQNWRCGSTNALYSMRSCFPPSTALAFPKTPTSLLTFPRTFSVCPVHFRFSSIQTPRNLAPAALWIFSPPNSSWFSVDPCLPGPLKYTYSVFLRFSVSFLLLINKTFFSPCSGVVPMHQGQWLSTFDRLFLRDSLVQVLQSSFVQFLFFVL